MRSKILLFFIPFAFSQAGFAQTIPSPEPTAACVAAATTDADRKACVGRAADACLAAVNGATEVDAAICVNAETGWWTDRLNAANAAMAAQAEALDRQHAAQIAKGGPKMVDDFALYQAAWKDWSEKRCIFEAMLRFGKPDRMVAASTCMMHLIADQALFLEASAAR
ncbi:DUF1311 domain-containing protein [Rhodobacter sp. Har01]|uniref:lysozyme inhibitor LprI family protein n=1 Tax=Rhodobacter sp. Har01 TaxID=2883999 RepID=UPI001D05F52A|nr:lysozyme inhibitor LprI family protein [Rhodobacter sp. Har01]MCB6178558.1 DUF1311 domain-containing protein [Rhodobacter sp. Har01]